MTLPTLIWSLPSPGWVGMFLRNLQAEGLRTWRDSEQLVTMYFLHIASRPRASEDGWIRTALSFKVATSPLFPRRSGLFWNAANHLCYWTFSLLASLLGSERALGAGRGNHPRWVVFTLLCSSITFPWKHTKFLAYWIANANVVTSSSVLMFWCYHQIGFSQSEPSYFQSCFCSLHCNLLLREVSGE